MTIRVYVRVSTADQRCELQVRELREYAERQGWQICGYLRGCEQWREGQPSCAKPAYRRRPSKKI
jgi:DNA invertase Pin-like site-specific DNA recombinase